MNQIPQTPELRHKVALARAFQTAMRAAVEAHALLAEYERTTANSGPSLTFTTPFSLDNAARWAERLDAVDRGALAN